MPTVISLLKERQKRAGSRPSLDIIGVQSNAASIIKTSLVAVDNDDKLHLFKILAHGSYRDMLIELNTRFEIQGIDNTRAVG